MRGKKKMPEVQPQKKINAVVFGSTGMVGEGVLHECLRSPYVRNVLVINRRPCGVKHDKLREIIVEDLRHLWTHGRDLAGYDACYFCAGVSSVGMDEDAYRRITYDLTMQAASTLLHRNPGLIFTYVSGLGTDSSEQGRTMWARVKGRTENHLMRFPFRASYMFRPGFLEPINGMTRTYPMYKVLGPVIPLLRTLLPSYVVSLENVGRAMINVTLRGYPKRILECRDITSAAT